VKRAGHFDWRHWLALPLLLAVLSAQAAEWAFEPSASLREEYNDNIRLTPLPHNSVWGTTLSPSVNFARRTEVSDTSGGLRLNMSHFSGDSNLDRVDQYYSISSNLKTERDTFALDASYTRDSTLVTEAQTTGIVLTHAQRANIALNPSWTHTLTERNALRLDMRYEDTRYSSAPASAGLVDYTDWTAAGGWLYQYSERDLLNLSVYNSRFQTASGNVKSNTVGIQGGITHNFSETLRGSFLVGVRSTKSTVESQTCDLINVPLNALFGTCFLYVPITQTLDSTASGSTLNAKLDKLFQTGGVSGTVSRELVPSGNGTLVETDRVGISARRQFSEKLGVGVDATASRSRYVGGAVIGNEVHYYTISPRLTWRMTQWWLLEAGYRHTEQSYQSGTGIAPSSNAVYVTVAYNWPKMAIAR
jgi:hypothetical protein